jgi:hypothetical protein
VPGASSETSTPQCPQRKERGNDKSGDLSRLDFEAGPASRSPLVFHRAVASTIVGRGEPSGQLLFLVAVGACRSQADMAGEPGEAAGGAGALEQPAEADQPGDDLIIWLAEDLAE